MSYLPRATAAATAEWTNLAAELDRWGEAGRIATLWWRDDDATTATTALDELLSVASNMPIALAVIPALARPELARALADGAQVSVLQHGWRHANRASHGKKSEYPEGLPAAHTSAEIAAGLARLKALFGALVVPVFVPPWNRLAGEVLPLLSACGIAGVSTMASKQRPAMPQGLLSCDVHLDLVAWSGDRRFVGETAALGGLVRQLQARRAGGSSLNEPIGILTHHLVMDRATAAFLERLLSLTTAHPAVRWAAIANLL